LEQSEGRFLFIGIAGVTVQATAEERLYKSREIF